MDGVNHFRDALQMVYGPLDWLPEPDGGIHRFHVPGDKADTLNGWYVLYLDGIASGAFGSWKAGSAHTWCSREPLDAREAEQPGHAFLSASGYWPQSAPTAKE